MLRIRKSVLLGFRSSAAAASLSACSKGLYSCMYFAARDATAFMKEGQSTRPSRSSQSEQPSNMPALQEKHCCIDSIPSKARNLCRICTGKGIVVGLFGWCLQHAQCEDSCCYPCREYQPGFLHLSANAPSDFGFVQCKQPRAPLCQHRRSPAPVQSCPSSLFTGQAVVFSNASGREAKKTLEPKPSISPGGSSESYKPFF